MEGLGFRLDREVYVTSSLCTIKVGEGATGGEFRVYRASIIRLL